MNGDKWGGRLLIENKARGGEVGRGHEAQRTLSRGSHGVTGGSPPGQTRFDGPRFIHSHRLEASNRNRHRINALPLFGGREWTPHRPAGSMQ